MKRRSYQHGFTLVEVMISTVVALFATLAIMQSFAVSEGYRRTSTSGGDAAFSGAVGAYVIDRDLKIAGYGINSTSFFGCQVSGYDERSATALTPFTLAPVAINPGATAATPDTVTVVSSNTGWLPGAIGLITAMGLPTDNYQINNPFGITAGDVLLLAESGKPCTIVQATNTPASAASNTVQHASGTYRTVGGATVAARYNPAGGIGPVYDANGVMMDLGAQPTVNRYYILNNTLMVDQLVTDQLAQPVAANVVQLKALYGKDGNADGMVSIGDATDSWDTVAPVTAADWANVLAIRLVLVARSAQPEKPSVLNGPCATTTAFPVVTWDDGTTTQLDLSLTAPTGPSWQCYRYKVFHVTASLRNAIWTPL